MSVYEDWLADGSPWRLSRPILDVRTALRSALPSPPPWCFGTLGDIAHLTAETPEDHTPYSQTGWPLPHPYPRVTALDIMHRPDLGVDCVPIFEHWITAARAGLIPWAKYLVWRGLYYDVRNGWTPVDGEGHFDHIHLSVRTDHIDTAVTWNPLPTGDDVSAKEVWEYPIHSPALGMTAPAVEWLKYTVDAYREVVALRAVVDRMAADIGIDPAELEQIKQAARDGATLGIGQIADAVGDELGDRLSPHPPD